MGAGPVRSASARRKQFWIAGLLLPAIFFRALIPAGFMPVLDPDGALRLQFCPGTSIAATNLHSMHVHHHDGAGDGRHDASHTQLTCPFAATASPAPMPTIAAIVWASPEFQLSASRQIGRDTVPTINRTQSPRAPPALA